MFSGVAASTGRVDSAFFFIVVTAAVLFLAVMSVMLVFLVRYGRRRHPEPRPVKESVPLEIVWTVIPLALVMAMFYLGWVDFEFIRNAPPGALPVRVTARQWSWLFQYANGREDDVLRAPAGRAVKLTMTSIDVVHCLYIPAFRIKEDCVPGMTTHLWFDADVPGTYDLFCTEYCGVGHAHMRSQVVIMPADEFDRWVGAAEETGTAAQGLKALKNKGCLGCHSLDGSRKVGPTFKGLVGSRQTVVTGGTERTVTADTDYLRRYVLDPNRDVVKGYPAVMPKIDIAPQDLDAILAYLETVK